MELNREQIVKALECCGNGCVTDCEECPRYDIDADTTRDCMEGLMRDALALINSQEQRIGAQDMTISELRQRAEKAEHDADRYAQRIKELTEEKEKLGLLIDELEKEKRKMFEENKRLTEENERLRAEVSTKKKLLDKCVDLEDGVRADTAREMQERFKERLRDTARQINGNNVIYLIGDSFIDQIAKEMLEGKDIEAEKG